MKKKINIYYKNSNLQYINFAYYNYFFSLYKISKNQYVHIFIYNI